MWLFFLSFSANVVIVFSKPNIFSSYAYSEVAFSAASLLKSTLFICNVIINLKKFYFLKIFHLLKSKVKIHKIFSKGWVEFNESSIAVTPCLNLKLFDLENWRIGASVSNTKFAFCSTGFIIFGFYYGKLISSVTIFIALKHITKGKKVPSSYPLCWARICKLLRIPPAYVLCWNF